MYPPRQRDYLVDVRGPQLTTGMCFIHDLPPNFGKINRPSLDALGDCFYVSIFVNLQNFAQ